MTQITQELIEKIPMVVSCEAGGTFKEFEEVLSFSKGTQIKLDESKENEILLKIDEITIARGRVLRKEGKMFIEVMEKFKHNEGERK